MEQLDTICMNDSFERPNWDEYFMLQAELAKLRSNCITRQVGAVIVRDHRQLATGYNGTPPGVKNCFEGGCKRCQLRMEGKVEAGASLDRCLCNHAEANAIVQAAKNGVKIDGSEIYVTASPCYNCFKLIANSGIKVIYYNELYRDERINDRAKEVGIELISLGD